MLYCYALFAVFKGRIYACLQMRSAGWEESSYRWELCMYFNIVTFIAHIERKLIRCNFRLGYDSIVLAIPLFSSLIFKPGIFA